MGSGSSYPRPRPCHARISQCDGIGQQCRAETAPLLEPALGAQASGFGAPRIWASGFLGFGFAPERRLRRRHEAASPISMVQSLSPLQHQPAVCHASHLQASSSAAWGLGGGCMGICRQRGAWWMHEEGDLDRGIQAPPPAVPQMNDAPDVIHRLLLLPSHRPHVSKRVLGVATRPRQADIQRGRHLILDVWRQWSNSTKSSFHATRFALLPSFTSHVVKNHLFAPLGMTPKGLVCKGHQCRRV